MIWRSTLVFLTSLTALTISVDSLRAESKSLLVAQSSVVDPSSAINTGEATPNVGRPAPSNLPNATTQQQSEEIKAIQQELKNLGYYSGPIDGIYGPITEEAIRAVRGQEGNRSNLPPSLFAPTPDAVSAPSQTADTTAVESAPDSSTELETPPSDPSADSVRINAAAAGTDTVNTETINIGDDVSPQTGIEPSDNDAVNTSEANASASIPSSSPGLGKLLWPGLALIAALGSFGIGFILSNRLTHSTDDKEEAPWGDVPGSRSQPEPPELSPPVLNGGLRTHNGTGLDNGSVINQTNQVENGLAVVPTTDAVSATTRLAKVDVIDELVANLQVTDPSKRRKAIWELGQRGNSSAVQHLVNGMVDADSKEKSLILAALSEIGIRSLKPMNRALAIALQDDNPDVRKNAIRDLTRVYDLVTQISQMLGHATEDEDPEVRRTAEWALGQLNRIREAPQLQSSLNTLEASRPNPSELLPDEVENLKN